MTGPTAAEPLSSSWILPSGMTVAGPAAGVPHALGLLLPCRGQLGAVGSQLIVDQGQ